MADTSDDESANGDGIEDIANKIRKLEKEKEKLEKQNLKQQYKELKESVGSLKRSSVSSSGISSVTGASSSSIHSSSSGKRRSTGSDNSNLTSVLNENRAKLENLQSRGMRRRNEASDESGDSDGDQDSKNLDKVMSQEHKQKLQIHRDTLVENMIPDDIFNDLIASKVLTTADVGRIKEKNTREAINEGLLNNLIVRSDRAFYEFTRSLRKTLQGYLADLMDEQSPRHARRGKQRHKRQIGELNVRVDCEDILPTAKRKKRQCSCKEVEEQILLMAKQAYQTIRRRDGTPAAFEQFKKELSQTNDVIKDSMEIMNTLKMLCQHDNDLDGIYDGSVVFRIRCYSLIGLSDLWDCYTSGQLLDHLQTGLITKNLLRYFHARSIKIRVRIAVEEYLLCLRELENKEVQLGKCLPSRCSSIIERRKLRSDTNDYRKLPVSNTTEPRRAFKEIQKNIAVMRDDVSGGLKTHCEKVPRVLRKRFLYKVHTFNPERNGIG